MTGSAAAAQTADISSRLHRPDLGQVSLFLDFDGTLVDLAATPDGIDVPAMLPRLLDGLGKATGGRTVIVTGRPVADIEKFLPTFTGTVIGSHGAELRQDGNVDRHATANGAVVEGLWNKASDFAQSDGALLAERKPTGVVLHFRQRPEAEDDVLGFMRNLATTTPGFALHPAKLAYELRPDDIGKELSVAALLGQTDFLNTLPVFFGDDTTDEPALDLVNRRGGIAVRVGPGDTAAPHRITDPAATRALLHGWLEEQYP